MRQKIVAGNWKMYLDTDRAASLARAVVDQARSLTGVQVILCPPFPYLPTVRSAVASSSVALGAQNCYLVNEGAFTGEVSPAMLVDCGCRYVILGHSERRHKLHEGDEFINHKVKAALAAGLHVILCVGETLDERQASHTHRVLDRHVTKGLDGVSADALARVVIAYEPVWAIGTGQNATPDQAQEAHAFLRQRVAELFGAGAARGLCIQYGGSVKPDNARSLLTQPDVDGALVGGASLDAASFLAIVRAALP